MKKILVLLVICCQAYAQQLEVKYFENPRVSTTEMNRLPVFIQKQFQPNRYSYTLSYQNGVSYYQNDDYSHLFNDETVYEEKDANIDGQSTTFQGKVEYDANIYKNKEKSYYKDLVDNEVYYTEQGYQVIDKPLDWQWEITDETAIIAGYSCRKATSNLMGRYFEAWYAEDIAVNAGPEKFDGLPGLILLVKMKGMEIVAHHVKEVEHLSEKLTKPTFEGKIYTFEELYSLPKNPPKQPQNSTNNRRTFIIETN